MNNQYTFVDSHLSFFYFLEGDWMANFSPAGCDFSPGSERYSDRAEIRHVITPSSKVHNV